MIGMRYALKLHRFHSHPTYHSSLKMSRLSRAGRRGPVPCTCRWKSFARETTSSAWGDLSWHSIITIKGVPSAVFPFTCRHQEKWHPSMSRIQAWRFLPSDVGRFLTYRNGSKTTDGTWTVSRSGRTNWKTGLNLFRTKSYYTEDCEEPANCWWCILNALYNARKRGLDKTTI